MYDADGSSLKDNTTEDVSLNVNVIDKLTQLAGAMDDFARTWGLMLNLNFRKQVTYLLTED